MDATSYDHFAGVYHLIFEDWEASVARQAASLSQLLSKCGMEGTGQRVLDCACGIGTQSLGLAMRGFQITGCDISAAAVQRARTEASNRNLTIDFLVADMRDLSALQDRSFDAVICMDNSLPHLTTDSDLSRAATQIRTKLRSGGSLIASIRDYDQALIQHPVLQGPYSYGEAESQRIVFQIWDWVDQFRYRFHLYVTRRIADEWETFHMSALYRAFRKDEITQAFEAAGFFNLTWISPAESGFYQPILIARVK